jgi:lipopolysaccharide export system protein LptA
MRLSEKRMAEIKPGCNRLPISSLRHLISVAILLVFSLNLYSQEVEVKTSGKRRIDLNHADEDNIERDKETGRDWHRLIGKVDLTHNDISMKCDSAHFYPDKNLVIAFSKIHINQADTLDIFGNYLHYDGATGIAIMNDNVELIDKETHLLTNSIHYDVNKRIAQYTDSGRITNGKNTLTSKIGIFYVTKKLFHFKDSVKIVNPDYVMTADTMDYNTESETAIFTGPSEMKGDSIYLYCERGWYDTKNNKSRISRNAVINNKHQIIYGDSIYYDDNLGYGESFSNITISDTTNNIIVKGNYAWYYKKPERFLVTDSAMYIQISKKDSLFLHADTISAVTISDTSDVGYRLMRAFHGCRIFSKDLQAKCDSLAYSFQDSVIRLYTKPVLWSEENQLTSDSMAIFTKNRQADKMELYNSAFIVSQVDTFRFDQIKGRSLTGYFRDNELYKINVEGNGESIYYLVDGDNVVGVNSARCASIEILIEKGKIQDIFQYQSPEGVIDPPSMSQEKMKKLAGFNWFDRLRPKKVADIFSEE